MIIKFNYTGWCTYVLRAWQHFCVCSIWNATFYTPKWSAFEICWSDARKARFSVIIWNRFGADSVNSGNNSTLVQTLCKLSACQVLQFDRCVLTKVKFFIGISFWGGRKCLEVIMFFILLQSILDFVDLGFLF